MKKMQITLITVAMLLPLFTAFSQTITFSPDKPLPGEPITITFDSKDTLLEDVETVDGAIYFLKDYQPTAKDLALKKEANVYIGTAEIPEDAKGIFVAFRADAETDIVVGGEEYGRMLYQKDRATPVPEAYLQKGLALGNNADLMGLERDFERAFDFMQKELAANPAMQSDFDLYLHYMYTANRVKDEVALAAVKTYISELEDKSSKTEDDFQLLSFYYNQIAEDKEKAASWKDKALQKFPKGQLALQNQQTKFREATGLDSKKEILEQTKKKFKDAENLDNAISYMARAMAGLYAREENWEKLDQYLAMVKEDMSNASTLNSLAWSMSGESIEGEARNLAKARKLSKQSLDIIENAMQDLGGTKPNYFTEKQWKNSLHYRQGMYADTYALITYKLGNHQEALEYQTITCENNDFANGENNERYAVYHEKVKGTAATMPFIEKMIRTNAATSKMKDQYKRIFMATQTPEQAFEKYMATLEEEANEEYLEELEKQMIDEKAPLFTLTNLDGEEVALKDLKGKVKIIDFWATWCGPCTSSFPAMQRAVEKYQDRDDVVFLFINSWERGENEQQNVADFIAKHDYPFNVPMDFDDEVISSFKVSGIPTKFIIDKNNRIRFKSIGFSGNDEKLINELDIMIELAAEASKDTASASLGGK